MRSLEQQFGSLWLEVVQQGIYWLSEFVGNADIKSTRMAQMQLAHADGACKWHMHADGRCMAHAEGTCRWYMQMAHACNAPCNCGALIDTAGIRGRHHG